MASAYFPALKKPFPSLGEGGRKREKEGQNRFAVEKNQCKRRE
jgi:hypothetical protein